jgi:hypothetical protein
VAVLPAVANAILTFRKNFLEACKHIVVKLQSDWMDALSGTYEYSDVFHFVDGSPKSLGRQSERRRFRHRIIPNLVTQV